MSPQEPLTFKHGNLTVNGYWQNGQVVLAANTPGLIAAREDLVDLVKFLFGVPASMLMSTVLPRAIPAIRQEHNMFGVRIELKPDVTTVQFPLDWQSFMTKLMPLAKR